LNSPRGRNSGALVDCFAHPVVASQAIFRGGTALHKLFFKPAGRYSEDIDLVQRKAGPIGDLINAIREVLDPWLGDPKWKQGQGRFTIYYRFETTFVPVVNMRLKIEINTREHSNVLGLTHSNYSVTNPWFTGKSEVVTYSLPELLGTKMRALYQRKKGRDIFDLWMALTQQNVDPKKIVRCFTEYMDHAKSSATRAQFEKSMAGKMKDALFLNDIYPLLNPGLEYDIEQAWDLINESLVKRLPGNGWKGMQEP
jgi:predicted nucleotidyltransferase component of viral defense system